MSEPELKVDLHEESGSEEEKRTESERIGEIATRVISPEVAAELAHEAKEYSQQSARLNERAAAELRAERVERDGANRSGAPDISTSSRPKDNVLRKVVAKTGLRLSLRSTSRGRQAILDGIASSFTDTWTTEGGEPSRKRAARVAEPFGSSLDQLWQETTRRNVRARTQEEAEKLNEAFAEANITPDVIAADLRRWREVLNHSGTVDLTAVLDEAGKLLADLRRMFDALRELLGPAEQYVTGLLGVTRGVEQTLRILQQGELPAATSAPNRCLDVARWTATLGEEPVARQRDAISSASQTRDRTRARIDKASADIAKMQRQRDTLEAENASLRTERETATAERKAEIDTKLTENDTTEQGLAKAIAHAQAEIAEEERRISTKLDVELAKLTAEMNAAADETQAVRDTFRQTGSPSAWADAVSAAATSASALPAEIRSQVAGLQNSSGQLDSAFLSLRRSILGSSDLEAVVVQAWDFASAIDSARETVTRLTAPAGAPAAYVAARRTMQLTLAAMADYVSVFLRGRALLRGE